jgi:hypothetical protein
LVGSCVANSTQLQEYSVCSKLSLILYSLV